MDLRKAVYQYAEANKITHAFNRNRKLAGKDWTFSFMHRYGLSLRTPQQTSLARMMGFNRVQMTVFFNNLSELVTKHRFSPKRIFNMDETGLSVVPNKVPKVMSVSGKKGSGRKLCAARLNLHKKA